MLFIATAYVYYKMHEVNLKHIVSKIQQNISNSSLQPSLTYSNYNVYNYNGGSFAQQTVHAWDVARRRYLDSRVSRN